VKEFTEKNDGLEVQLSKNQGKDADLESARAEVRMLRQEQIEMTNQLEEKEQEGGRLRGQVEQLQNKRKSLL
jgi:hypothetical protein